MLTITAVSGDYPVDLAAAKEHCRIDEADDGAEDALINRLIRTATAFCQDRTTLFLRQSTVEMTRDSWWSGALLIPAAPVREVSAVRYLDENNSEQTLDTGLWSWRAVQDGAEIRIDDGVSLPRLTTRVGCVTVAAEVGVDPAGTSESAPRLTLPPQIEEAMLLLIGHWYENREAVNVGNIVTEFPLAAVDLLAQVRIYR